MTALSSSTPEATPEARRTGFFLVLEGTDGAGKTTLTPVLADLLRQRTGRTVHTLREPGGTPEGERIRDIVKDPGLQMPHDGVWSLLMFSAARRSLLQQVIAPALAKGDVVVVDRFVLSTLLYQGQQGVPREVIEAVSALAIGPHGPDVTVVIEVEAEELARRHAARVGTAEAADVYERSGSALARQRAYVELAGAQPNATVVSVRRGETPEDVAAAVLTAIAPRLATRGISVAEPPRRTPDAAPRPSRLGR